jgi:SPOR domain
LRPWGWPVLPLLLPLLAAGCVLPPAVTVASLAADGVSYATTGKSVTDHGISAATGEDCALLRPVLNDKPICDSTLTARGKAVPVEQGIASVPPPMAATLVRDQAPVRDQYVTVGSFLDPANAARAAAAYAPLQVNIVPAEVEGRQFHRVVVGPLSHEEAAKLKLRLAAG